jgi:P pilus assembly chaperone PapD
MTGRRLGLCLAVLASLAVGRSGLAQGVLIAPTAVFIDGRVRTGSILLVNPNDDPAEIEISTLFGYPVTDSVGDMKLLTREQPDSAGEPSATPWVKVYPRRLTLAPKAQQTLRLLATPPPAVPDGEYWTRLVIVARGGVLPVAVETPTSGVSVGLTMEVRTMIPLFYRKGTPQTGLALSRLRATRVADSLVVRARLERQGTAAALGTARGELLDGSGKVRASFTAPVAAYHTVEPRFTASIGDLRPGTYRLRFEVAPGRKDLPAESVLPFRAVRDSITVTLP